ncbi:hypothetical protein [Alistipes putredinis]
MVAGHARRAALVLCTGALAGSIACAWLLWRSIGGRTHRHD